MTMYITSTIPQLADKLPPSSLPTKCCPKTRSLLETSSSGFAPSPLLQNADSSEPSPARDSASKPPRRRLGERLPISRWCLSSQWLLGPILCSVAVCALHRLCRVFLHHHTEILRHETGQSQNWRLCAASKPDVPWKGLTSVLVPTNRGTLFVHVLHGSSPADPHEHQALAA